MNEHVPFRLFAMPCCGFHLCWINPRFPSHCPECGASVYAQLRTEAHTLVHAPAWLRLESETKLGRRAVPRPASIPSPDEPR